MKTKVNIATQATQLPQAHAHTTTVTIEARTHLHIHGLRLGPLSEPLFVKPQH